MTAHDVAVLLLALGVLLATARGLGELAKRFKQPEVLGEILAGILLGPSVLGVLAPSVTSSLFPAEGPTAVALSGLTALGITLFLLVAGLEVDFAAMRQHGRVALGVGVWGMVVPFALGLGVAVVAPGLLERELRVPPFVFALFFATAMSISALPVIARVLMDLNIYRTNVGMVTIGAAFGDNLVGAIVFAIILGMAGGGPPSTSKIAATVVMALGFTAAMLTVVRWCVHRVLPWIEEHTSRSSGVLGFALSLTLVGAALSEWLGVHAVLGAFLVGVVIGDSSHFREWTRSTILGFVSAFFAPLFFAAIGLGVNFAASFDWSLALVVLVVATAGKVVGCGASALWSGWSVREAGAIGFAMNARGAMEIVFGLLGYRYGVISERMFVALVVMAIATSLLSGPAMKRLLRLRSPRPIGDYQGARVFLQPLLAESREGAIKELLQAAGAVAAVSRRALETSLFRRDYAATGPIAGGVAVRTAEVEGLEAPLIGVGVPRVAIDFDDTGEPADLIFVVLTPPSPGAVTAKLLRDLARRLKDAGLRERALATADRREFVSLLNS